ncbi:MAG TPA: protein-L-isoaspartate(D-aspartate) O-methyltransferase, partial [Rhizomicrobium sp.]|nr:protein-L-isoaspartate(D-aspartate) O-methyltransferase [Rhizomicrobium sp.]
MSEDRAAALAQSLRNEGITDERVLQAIAATPREAFLEEAFDHSAYENAALPIACGQTISQPYIVAYMTQALELDPKHRVLEIGTGSGYQAAVLSPLCRMVYSIERHRALLKQAETRFKTLRLSNIVTKLGDGFKGWPEQAPFDRIILTAATPEVPESLIEQLKPGGILIAPVGHAPAESISQRLVKMIRTGEGVKREPLIPVVFVPMLPGVPEAAKKSDDEGS